MYEGIVRNESENPIILELPITDKPIAWEIGVGDKEKIFWNQSCIILRQKDRVDFYSAYDVLKNAKVSGVFTAKLKFIFKNDALYYLNIDGAYSKFKKVNSCSQA